MNNLLVDSALNNRRISILIGRVKTLVERIKLQANFVGQIATIKHRGFHISVAPFTRGTSPIKRADTHVTVVGHYQLAVHAIHHLQRNTALFQHFSALLKTRRLVSTGTIIDGGIEVMVSIEGNVNVSRDRLAEAIQQLGVFPGA